MIIDYFSSKPEEKKPATSQYKILLIRNPKYKILLIRQNSSFSLPRTNSLIEFKNKTLDSTNPTKSNRSKP